MALPANTIIGGGCQYCDASTLKPIGKTEWARRCALQWYEAKNAWPTVVQLQIVSGVGHGTAQEGLKRARDDGR